MTTATTPTTPTTRKTRRAWVYVEGLVLLSVCGLVLAVVYWQFRGNFTPKTELTMVASRAGLVMEPGSKVTYNGVEIGRVAGISEMERDGIPAAKLTLDVNPRYINLIPANVVADIEAATLFGNKYVSLTSPERPVPQRISPRDEIDVRSVTTEFNTLFETITSIAEKVDPIELNATLSALAQALDGLGGKFGESIVNGNEILAQLNPRMPQIRYDIRRLTDLADVYRKASPDLWDFLRNAVTTAHTLTEQQGNLDAALLAAVGAGRTGEDIFARAGPYLVRGAADLVPTAELLDTYSPELFCMIRNFHDAAPKVANAVGGNGYSLAGAGTFAGAPNPYVYPDNLPRVNARGGPGGRPGCWQTITRELWPAPYLVMDTGASLAPYNHLELGQPLFTEYVWGRQYGENTINP
ncbi:MAG TPA: MCE family protein [Mycobacterium sp.]|nr:MCE family protein [Mycobacterium sp.]